MTTVLVALLLFADRPEPAPPKRPPAVKPQGPSFEKLSQQANAAREQGELEKAIDLYQQAVKAKPAWNEGWWYLATLLYDQDRYTEGRDAFRRYVTLDPKSGRAFALLGLCEYQTKEYEPALGHLNHARALGLTGAAPQLVQVAMYHTAILLTRFEQFEAAVQLLMELAKQGNTSPSVVEAAGLAALRKPLLPPELPSQDRELVLMIGRAVCSSGRWEVNEAKKQFEIAIAAYPKSPNVHFTYGVFLLWSNPEAAIEVLNKELELDPKHLPSLLAVVFEYIKRGEPEKGRDYAERAVKIAPKSFGAHAAFGRVLVESGHVEEGIKELEESKRLAPLSPQVRIALASAYAKVGRAADAARERGEFLKLKKASDAAFGEPEKQP